MNHFFACLIILCLTPAYASEKTDTDWTRLLTYKKLPITEQAYCFTNEQGKLEGLNLNQPVRIASVSKLLTSLWAMEVLGPDYRFVTKLTLKNSYLHLEGSLDPFLGNEKMFFLLSQLNDLGIEKLDKITFDKIIQINPGAQIPSDQYPLITRESNAKNLLIYFNTSTWTKEMREDYARIAARAPKGVMRPAVKFELGAAHYAETNPYAKYPEVHTLKMNSAPLFKYIKEINIESNNYAAHTLFRKLGGVSAFAQFMQKRFGINKEGLQFYNGSGLPEFIDGKRVDNYATCTIATQMIEELKGSAERQGLEIEDIVAVPGSDGGTFRNRLFPEEYRNAFVAKTGTLMHTSALAGAMKTQKGFSFYGIFNQSTDIVNSKIVQNEMIGSIMTEMGGPKAFNYTVSPFTTYGDSGLKSLWNDSASDFIPFETGLY